MQSELVCQCLKIELHAVESFLKRNPHASLEEVKIGTKAGSRCQACVTPSEKGVRKYYLSKIWENFQDGLNVSSEPQNFLHMSLYHKILLVEELLKNRIRPLLKKDGGDVEVVNITDKEIFLEFLGACETCPSSIGGTLSYIRETLLQGLGVDQLQINLVGQ